MSDPQVEDPRKRSAFESLARRVGAFLRKFNPARYGLSPEEQKLDAVQQELDELEKEVEDIQEQGDADHETIVRLLTGLQNRVKGLILLIAGGIVAGGVGALPQKWFPDKACQPFNELLYRLEETVLRPEAPPVIPAHEWEPELIHIRAGGFMMGSDKVRDPLAYDDELPDHRVYLNDFYIGKYPVTNGQYRRFVEMEGHSPPPYWTGYHDELKVDHPVNGVSWHDALAYCEWLSREAGRLYQLPSEAEWEKAARGTYGRIYPWGNRPPTDALSNFHDANVRTTTPVGHYSPQGDSPYGCKEMAGNVWEWTRSHYRSYPYDGRDGRENDWAGDDVVRVLRGGSFLNYTRLVRCACRNWRNPCNHGWDLGFRVVVAPLPLISSTLGPLDRW